MFTSYVLVAQISIIIVNLDFSMKTQFVRSNFCHVNTSTNWNEVVTLLRSLENVPPADSLPQRMHKKPSIPLSFAVAVLQKERIWCRAELVRVVFPFPSFLRSRGNTASAKESVYLSSLLIMYSCYLLPALNYEWLPINSGFPVGTFLFH